MRKVIGVLLIVLGIAAGIYVGLYLCFIQGLIGAISRSDHCPHPKPPN
jgi:hypothetical protein